MLVERTLRNQLHKLISTEGNMPALSLPPQKRSSPAERQVIDAYLILLLKIRFEILDFAKNLEEPPCPWNAQDHHSTTLSLYAHCVKKYSNTVCNLNT